MNIGIIKSTVVIDAALFDDMATAQQFLALGVWPGADVVAELPEGYGIGDSYDGENWIKAPTTQPEEPQTEEPTPTAEERIAELETINRQQAAKITAQTQSITMLEDCLVEMAGVVYA